jgi:hypothetical protein
MLRIANCGNSRRCRPPVCQSVFHRLSTGRTPFRAGGIGFCSFHLLLHSSIPRLHPKAVTVWITGVVEVKSDTPHFTALMKVMTVLLKRITT